jgi:hypothetical protein
MHFDGESKASWLILVLVDGGLEKIPFRRGGNAHYILTSIPVREVLSIFRPHLMCPRALTVELRITTGSQVRVSRFKKLDHTVY